MIDNLFIYIMAIIVDHFGSCIYGQTLTSYRPDEEFVYCTQCMELVQMVV